MSEQIEIIYQNRYWNNLWLAFKPVFQRSDIYRYLSSVIRIIDTTDSIVSDRLETLNNLDDKVAGAEKCRCKLAKLPPEPVDIEVLRKLLKVVQSATDRNTKVTQITANAEEFAGVVLGLAKKFV